MKLLTEDECHTWLNAHGYKYTPPQLLPIKGASFMFRSEILVELLKYIHTLIIETRNIHAQRISIYSQLVNWLTQEPALIFQTWTADEGEYEGGLTDYLQKNFPEFTSVPNPGALVWEAGNTENKARIVDMFDDFVELNWQAYALNSDFRSSVWLADEIIEAGTNDSAEFISMRAAVDSCT